jgi:hypothetical protein
MDQKNRMAHITRNNKENVQNILAFLHRSTWPYVVIPFSTLVVLAISPLLYQPIVSPVHKAALCIPSRFL